MSEQSEPGSERRSLCAHCGRGVSRANVRENTYECPTHGVISGASVHYVEDDGLRADGGRVPCPDCEHGTLRVSDGVYADCDACDAAVLRNEVGL